MGAYLVVIFIALIAFACGMILLCYKDKSSIKIGMYMVAVGVILGICCMFVQPKNNFVPQSWTDRY